MRRNLIVLLTPLLLAGLLTATPVQAQETPLDTASLANGPSSRMHTLLEKTLLKVDVLTLDIRFDDEVAGRLAELASGSGYSAEVADSIAEIAARATNVFARLEFQRNVSLGQFLDGIRENLHHARDAGYITAAEHDEISDGLPVWYEFLAERGIRDGDVMLYRIRDDRLRVVYIGNDGQTLLDRTDPGAHRRLAVLGSYFAAGSDFRDGLIRSLFD